MLIKLYGETIDKEGRYSPPTCIGTREERILGYPDKAHVSTSYVERQNLNMRMGMRRFTRLTTDSQRKSRTTRTPSHSTTCSITSRVYTKRCAARPRWRPALRIILGRWKKSFRSRERPSGQSFCGSDARYCFLAFRYSETVGPAASAPTVATTMATTSGVSLPSIAR